MTTNNVGLIDTIDMRDLYAKLDFAAFDNYPGFFDMLMAQEGKPPSSDGIATTVSLGHDLARSVKGGEPFMIMEEQSGKAGQKSLFSPAGDRPSQALDLSGGRAWSDGSELLPLGHGDFRSGRILARHSEP